MSSLISELAKPWGNLIRLAGLHRRAKEYFEQGMAKSNDQKEQLVFQKEIEELVKIQKKCKAEFLASMEISNAVPLEMGYRVPIKENKKDVVQEVQSNVPDRPKAYEDFFGLKFHERYTYDFLKLKDIDGKPISRKGTGQASEQAETSIGKVKFILEESPNIEKQNPKIRMKSILKKKPHLSTTTQPPSDLSRFDNESMIPSQELQIESSKMTYDELD